MRKIKSIVCLLFVASLVLAGGYTVWSALVKDHRAPQIKMEENEIKVSVEDGRKAILKGVTAKDNRDGDLTKSIQVASMSHFITPGKRTVQYVVFDKAGNVSTAERTLVYTDYSSPKIKLTMPLIFSDKTFSSANITENMVVEDNLDGDISSQIRVLFDGNYRYDTVVGTYPIKVSVSNSAGDVRTVSVNLEIIDSTSKAEMSKSYPMLSEYIIYTKVNKPVDLNGYIKGVIRNGAEYTFAADGEAIGFGQEAIAVHTGNVKYDTPGDYIAEISYTNEAGVTATTKLVIVVEE